MKKLFTVIISFILLLGTLSFTIPAAEASSPDGEYEPNVLLIKFHPKSMFPDKVKQYENELDKVKSWGFDYIEVLDVHVVYVEDMDKNPNAALNRFKNNQFIEYVEFNHLGNENTVPNDTNYKNSGSIYAKVINAEAGWDIITDSKVAVAVIDSGYGGNKDLPAAQGYNTVDKNTNITGGSGHGTKTAGTLGAIGNNKTGNTGVVWNANIMPVKTSNTTSYAASNVAAGITWAADNGAQIISISLSFASNNTTLKNAIDYAYGKGCVIIAATSNNGESEPRYPARYNNVLGVGAATTSHSRESYSNYGEGLDVLASGTWVTTDSSGGYAAASGTSIATPQVAGLAALVWELAPGLSNADVMNLIRGNAKDIGAAGWDAQTGYGVIDMGKTLAAAAALGGAAEATPAPTATPTPSPTPSPTATPTPTPTPSPTPTPAPTPSPTPTPTATPTPSPTPKPTPASTPAPTPAPTVPPTPREVVTREEIVFKGSGNPNKGPVPFKYTVNAQTAGIITLKVEGISGVTFDVTVKNSAGETVLATKSFTANGFVDFSIDAAGTYTIDAALRDGKGNSSFTLKVLMPEVITLVDPDTPLAGFAGDEKSPMTPVIIISVSILLAVSSTIAIIKKRKADTKQQ